MKLHGGYSRGMNAIQSTSDSCLFAYKFTCTPESYVFPGVQSWGMSLTGTTQVSSSSSLKSILIDRDPLGGEEVVHTAP